MEGLYIQFGCGMCAPDGWKNFDAGPAFWLQKYVPFSKPVLCRKGFPDYPVRNIEYGDIVLGLPVKQGSANAVYCSHVLEHLALAEFRRAIRNVYQYLEPGGVFRLVVPDFEYLIQQYCASSDPKAASQLLEGAHLGEAAMRRGIASLPQTLFGRSKHLWMWDYKAMASELADAGFVDIRRAYYNDSRNLRFQEVENPGRWENCLGVECRKP
jgi:SAM-dependent methyltransferase